MELRFVLVLYPKELDDEMVRLIEAAGVPGYTELPKLIGKGQRPHLDNPVWPGATGAIFSVVGADRLALLVERLREYGAGLEARSHGLHRVHVYALPCEQLV